MNKKFLFLTIIVFVQTSLAETSEIDASCPITVRDYYSMLMIAPDSAWLYSEAMEKDPQEIGIIRTKTETGYQYQMVPGMEEQPMKELSQEQAAYYHYWLQHQDPSGQQSLTLPLMWEPGREKGEEKNGREAQAERHLRESTREAKGNSSNLQQRSNTAAVAEYPEPPTVITTDSLDDVSTLTGTDHEAGSLMSLPQSVLSPTIEGFNRRLIEAEQKLKNAQYQSKKAATALDSALAQWEAAVRLLTVKKNVEKVREAYGEANNAYVLAMQHLQGAVQPQEASIVTEASPDSRANQRGEVLRAWNRHVEITHLFHQAMINAGIEERRAQQEGVIEGVEYGALLSQAQKQANDASDCVKRYQQELDILKARIHAASHTADTSTKKEIASIDRKSSRLGEAQAEASPISSQEPGIVFPEGLATSKYQASLNKQATWKLIFQGLVDKVKQMKRDVADGVLKQLINDEELLRSIAGEVLAEQKQEETITRTVRQALHDVVTKIVDEDNRERSNLAAAKKRLAKKEYLKRQREREKLMAAEAQRAEEEAQRKKKQQIFSDLFYSEGETTVRDAWEMMQESIAHRQNERANEHAEMEKFCAEHRGFVYPDEEVVQKPISIFLSYYRDFCSLVRKGAQAVQDSLYVQKEALEATKKFFQEQGRSMKDVPSLEFGLKNAEFSQTLYAKIKEERAAQAARLKEGEFGEPDFLAQLEFLFEPANYIRFWRSLPMGDPVDYDLESDQRALDYFQERGREPSKLEFWSKSAEFQKQINKKRLKKAAELIRQYPNKDEALRAGYEWGMKWPERLELERQQKEAARLQKEQEEQERSKQKELEERERIRQEAEKTLLEQEAAAQKKEAARKKAATGKKKNDKKKR